MTSKVATRGMRIALPLCLGALLHPGSVLAQTAPVAPSQVTPRSLRPPPPVLPPPIELPRSLPAEAPPGSDNVRLRVGALVAEAGYEEMAAQTQAILGSLAGKQVSVGQLYRAAAALEAAYAKSGFFLARIVVPQQRVADGETFRVTVVDGFIETLDDSALPWRIRKPIHRTMAPIVGKRKLLLDEMQRRLETAGAVPGAKMRSTLAQGEAPGAARLILDGRYDPLGLTIGGDNRLGPSFNNWGVNLQGSINSPTGHGEQIYVFLSGQPRLDETFKQDSLRRVGGLGFTLPVTDSGIVINPEFTVSDTNPEVANPLFASNGRLYRSVFNVIAPIASNSAGTTTGKLTLEITDERQKLPAFMVTLSKDKLTVLRGNLAWRGQAWPGASASAETTLSQGVKAFGARTPAEVAASDAPSSRGSDPQFTRAEVRASVQQTLFSGAALTLIARAQSSFGTIVPNSETFDLTGTDALSSFTAGGLSADGGFLVRSEISYTTGTAAGRAQLFATPYVFAAAGRSHYVVRDPLSATSATSYGAGLRLAGQGFPLGASPNATLEYGHSHQNRGVAPDDRLSVSLGVSF